MSAEFPKDWGLLQQASRDLPDTDQSNKQKKPSRLFENRGSGDNDWHYFILQANDGTLSLVADCHDSSISAFDVTNTITFYDPDVLRDAITRLNRTGVAFVSGTGQIHENSNIQQIGSAWDAEECVYSEHKNQTKKGNISCQLQLKNGKLEDFNYEVK